MSGLMQPVSESVSVPSSPTMAWGRISLLLLLISVIMLEKIPGDSVTELEFSDYAGEDPW